MQFLGFNQTIAPFDNLQVRQAIQHAINKQNIADAVFYGNYTLGAGPIAPGLPGYDETLADDLSATIPSGPRRCWRKPGWARLSFDLYNRTNSFWPLMGQLIQADLEAVGMTANLRRWRTPSSSPR